MKRIIILYTLGLFLAGCASVNNQSEANKGYNEEHRPQFHFSPNKGWMNDPNGMVSYNGKYHLFFQHNPDSTVWGPMHWGHATSTDLIHWEEQPIALFPDSLGTIFSGSAIVDLKNTTGFGKDGKVPLVAIFTHHNQPLEQKGSDKFQYQSLAYSLDEGKTWIKYEGNPVLQNPGIRDFRDPKVMWHEVSQKWIMTLATKDRITFYSSPDLKSWKKLSEFGENVGAHGGVWECPDLFPLTLSGKEMWVLLVSINPGGPNGGSATQYFVGDFDGERFIPASTETKWVDWGPDNYAGITWSNTGKRKIFLGWMSNWQYANVVPTSTWRSATTIPRELSLKSVNDNVFLASEPVKEFEETLKPDFSAENVNVKGTYNLTEKIKGFSNKFQLKLSSEALSDFSIVLTNDSGEELIVGYNKKDNVYYIDRTKAGKIDFEKGFAKKHTAPRLAKDNKQDLTLVVDAASVELFADDGKTVMTGIFFPTIGMNKVMLNADQGIVFKEIQYSEVSSIWR